MFVCFCVYTVVYDTVSADAVKYLQIKYHKLIGTVACRVVTMRRPRDRRIYLDASRQRLCKHGPAAMNRRAGIEVLLENGVFLHGPCRGVILKTIGATG
jgi:hypothetical protein